MIFGGVDNNRFSGSISWVPVWPNNSVYWSTFISGPITIPAYGKTVKMDSSSPVIFDTGTSWLYMSNVAAFNLNVYLGLVPSLPVKLNSTTQYSVDCSITGLPDVILNIGGASFTLTQADYIVQPIQSGSCFSIFNGRSDMTDTSILLGNVLLRKWVVVFDYEKRQIGLVNANRQSTSIPKLSGITTPPTKQYTSSQITGGGASRFKILGTTHFTLLGISLVLVVLL